MYACLMFKKSHSSFRDASQIGVHEVGRRCEQNDCVQSKRRILISLLLLPSSCVVST